MKTRFAEIREFREQSGDVSVASIVRKQGDESKRNFTARDEILHRHFVPAGRNFVLAKRNVV